MVGVTVAVWAETVVWAEGITDVVAMLFWMVVDVLGFLCSLFFIFSLIVLLLFSLMLSFVFVLLPLSVLQCLRHHALTFSSDGGRLHGSMVIASLP